MQGNITQFGRVEFDATSLPRVNFRATDDPALARDPFIRELDRASTQLRRDDAASRRDSFGAQPNGPDATSPGTTPAAEDPTVAPRPTERRDRTSPNASRDAAADASADAAGAVPVAPPPAPAPRAHPNQSTDFEGPASRSRQGKGAGPSPFIPDRDVQGQAAGGALAGASAAAASASNAAAAPAAAGAASAVTPLSSVSSVPGSAPPHDAASAATRDANVRASGYASLDPRRLQLAEQARDSMFRQIAMRLTPTGGEMRIFVDPPELGELEMRLQVDGDVMKLAVIAERPEVALTLQKHLPELRQQLAAQGIQVTEADISAREDGDPAAHDASADAAWRDHGEFGASHESDNEPQPDARRARGFMRADGFDLWI